MDVKEGSSRRCKLSGSGQGFVAELCMFRDVLRWHPDSNGYEFGCYGSVSVYVHVPAVAAGDVFQGEECQCSYRCH